MRPLIYYPYTCVYISTIYKYNFLSRSFVCIVCMAWTKDARAHHETSGLASRANYPLSFLYTQSQDIFILLSSTNIYIYIHMYNTCLYIHIYIYVHNLYVCWYRETTSRPQQLLRRSTCSRIFFFFFVTTSVRSTIDNYL